MKRTVRVRLAAAAAGGMILAVVVPAGSAETQPDPGGNNGTVKVDGVEFDSHPDNQPHVGCVFQIDFYNYDANPALTAAVEFEAVNPTPGGVLLNDTVPIGGDAAGGGNDLDASRTYNLAAALASIEPHPVQGHHVRLTVNAQGSQGSDVKHKVFWVEGCGIPTTTTTSAPPQTTAPPGTTTPGGTSPTTARPGAPSGSTQPSGGAGPSRGAPSSSGSVATNPASPARAVPGRPQFTG